MDPGPSIAGIGISLLILALTSAIDAAFTSVSWRRLHTILADRAAHSRVLAHFTNDPYRLKATVTLLNTSATMVAAVLTFQLTAGWEARLQAGAFLLLVVAVVTVSVALPRALALSEPIALVQALAGPVSLLTWVCWPLVALANLLTRPVACITGSQSMPSTPLVTEEEVRLLVDAGAEEGLFKHDEREMIEGVFSFNDTIVREVMVPRMDIVALEATTPLEEALETVIREGHSRIPIYQETVDTIIGILYAKDLLPALRDGQRDIVVAQLMRPAHFVPEIVKVDVLLKELQLSKIHMAIIVDEYGGTTGLATIEDLIEEIVGEIQDEYDTDEDPPVMVVSATELIADARVPLSDFNALTRLTLASAGADRIGGLVYERLGRVPQVNDEVVLDDAVIRVLSMHGVRPEKLRITLRQPPEAPVMPSVQHEDSHLSPYHVQPEALVAWFVQQ